MSSYANTAQKPSHLHWSTVDQEGYSLFKKPVVDVAKVSLSLLVLLNLHPDEASETQHVLYVEGPKQQ